jgi:hypothetical protein
MTDGTRDDICACDCGARYCASNSRPKEKVKSPSERLKIRNARLQRLQADALSKAERYRTRWTSWELDLLTRPDLSTSAIASMTGRSYYAITSKRKKLHEGPKLQRVVDEMAGPDFRGDADG